MPDTTIAITLNACDDPQVIANALYRTLADYGNSITVEVSQEVNVPRIEVVATAGSPEYT